LINIKQELQNYQPINIVTLESSISGTISDDIRKSIALYNNALMSLQGGSEDIAVIELKKAISLNPDFLEAMNLLGLCYIHLNEPDLAADMFKRVAKAETNGVNAFKYMSSLERGEIISDSAAIRDTHKSRTRKRRPGKAVVTPEGAGEETSQVKKSVKRNLKRELIKLAVVFAAGFLVMFLIAAPYMFKKPEPEPVIEVVSKEEYDAAVAKGAEFERKYNSLNQEYQQLQKRLNEAEATIDYYNRVKKINEVEDLYKEGKIIEAADMLLLLSDVEYKDVEVEKLEKLRTQVLPQAAEKAYQEGVNLCQNAQDYEAALEMLTKVEQYAPDFNKMAGLLYYTGKSYQYSGQFDKALEKYNELLEKFPNDYYVQYTHYRISEINAARNN